jgi:hypothetical protein
MSLSTKTVLSLMNIVVVGGGGGAVGGGLRVNEYQADCLGTLGTSMSHDQIV